MGHKHTKSRKLESKTLEAKIVLVGDSAVGKSCILNILNNGVFPQNVNGTAGAAYFTKIYRYPDGKSLKLHIWDTSGVEKF